MNTSVNDTINSTLDILANQTSTGEDTEESTGVEWYIILVCCFLALLSACFSGLNLGIMSLDPKYLELLAMPPFEDKVEEQNARYAKKILPLRKRGNLLLCTILLGNVSVNALFSILLSEDAGGVVGFVASTVTIFIFGELFPQSAFKRFGLPLSAACIYLLYFFMAVTFILAFPIAAILDKCLGEEVGNVLSKSKMKRMFEIYEKEQRLTPSEKNLLSAALEMQETIASTVMTPLEKAYMLDIDSKLDSTLLREIYETGFSRIPIYQGVREQIVGILLTRDLILIKPELKVLTIRQLSSIMVRNIVLIQSKASIGQLLKYFQKGQSHMGIVTQVQEEVEQKDDVLGDPVPKTIGIITLEDCIGELLKQRKNDDEEDLGISQTIKPKQKLKEKLILLFSDKKDGKSLDEAEIQAIGQYLQRQVKAFEQGHIRREVLHDLIRKSDIIELEGDANPLSLLEVGPTDANGVPTSRVTEENAFLNQFSKVPTWEKKLKESPLKRREMMKQEKLIFGRQSKMGDMSAGKKVENDIEKQAQPEEIEVEVEEGAEAAAARNTIYKKGDPSDEFYLILKGKILVCSGQEGFFIELSSFNFLGSEALTNDKYSPDFSAKAIEKTRLIRIKRMDYRKALFAVKNIS